MNNYLTDDSKWFIKNEPDDIILADDDTRKMYDNAFQFGNRLGSPVMSGWIYILGNIEEEI